MIGRCRLSSVRAAASVVLHCDQRDAKANDPFDCRLSSTTATGKGLGIQKSMQSLDRSEGPVPKSSPGRGLFDEGVKNAELFRARYWLQQCNCCVW